MRSGRSWRGNAAALGVGLVVSILLLELGLRVFQPLETRVRGGQIVLATHREWRYQSGVDSQLDPVIVHRRNNIGFRGEDWSEGDRALRVFALGGSTTACTYLSEGRTWPDRVAARLQANFRDLWLNNAGLDGHSTFGHQILLRDHIVRYEPDVLLLLVGINDIGRGRLSRGELSILKQLGVAGLLDESELVALVRALHQTVAARSRRIAHNTRGLDESWLVDWEIDAATVDSIVSVAEAHLDPYRDRLRGLVQAGLGLGVEMILLTQPVLYGDAFDDRTGLDLGRIYVEGVDGSTAWRMLERYNDVTRSVAQENGLLLIDLAAKLPKSSRYFYDTIHLTNEGAGRVAELVAEPLCRHLAIRFPERAASPCSGDSGG
jgi:lysophospholipase L1-like esterase